MCGAMFDVLAMHFGTRQPSDDFVAIVYDVENLFTHVGCRICVRRTNCSRLTFSARICGERPISSKAPLRESFGQACFKRLNIILRRCEKPRLTILTNAAR